MILATGLSPAWQQILSFDSFRSGEVNRASQTHWCASGKVLNVGIALAHLGGPSLTISPVGHAQRAMIDEDLEALRVPRRWIVTNAPTRVCTTVLDTSSGTTTELVENAHPLTDDELTDLEQTCREQAANADVVVFTGSLPPGTPRDFFRRLLAHTQAPAVLDIRGPELLEALKERPLLVKPNRQELADTLGRSLDDERDLAGAMGELVERGAQWALVTDGSRDAWVRHEDRFWKVSPLAVETINPIGCGDCLAAGIAWSLREGEEPLQAIRNGIAAAAENAAMLLPSRLDPGCVAARAKEVTILEV